MWLISYYAVIPGIKFFFLSTKDASVLEAKINELVPEDATIDNIAVKDLMIPAWDLNHRTPRFFTKWSYNNLKGKM